ncbi:Nn.00g116400.m01.CDS01 [Neocucurbitaria sp. VM-36]
MAANCCDSRQLKAHQKGAKEVKYNLPVNNDFHAKKIARVLAHEIGPACSAYPRLAQAPIDESGPLSFIRHGLGHKQDISGGETGLKPKDYFDWLDRYHR